MNVNACNHPMVQWMITELRNEKTIPRRFHELVCEISRLLLFTACTDLPSAEIRINTPTREVADGVIPGCRVVVVPVIRAAIPMAEVAFDLIPDVEVCHIGEERDERTAEARAYYEKRVRHPKVESLQCIVVDPMFATGGSANGALDIVKGWGMRNIRLVGIIASEEGITAINTCHPDVSITVAAVDPRMNEHKYILPGLGDAGDRAYNT